MALFIAALGIWFLLRVVEVLLLGFLAVLLALYLGTITDLLERRARFPRWVGLIATGAGTLAIIVGIGALIVPPVIDQTQSLIAGLPQSLTDIQNVLAQWASQYPVIRRTELANPQSGLVASFITDVAQYVSGSALPYARAGGKLLVEAASVLVMAVYLSNRPALYRDGVVYLVPPAHRDVATRILEDAGATLRAWIVGQLITMVLLGFLTAAGLWALGVPYWLAFGMFTGLVAIVPFFGAFLSTLLPALLVLGSGDWGRALAVIALGVGVHVVEANLVNPLIMEKKVALPPVLTIASVLIMGTLLGGVGLVVAVPVLAVAIVVVRHVLRGEIYGEGGHHEPAVLRHSGQFRVPRPRPPAP